MAVSGRQTDAQTKERAAKLAAAGRSKSEIARRLNLSLPTVRKILRDSR